MSRNFHPEFLRRLQNEIPIDWLIKHLGWPHKRRDGRFIFLCPRCHESVSDIKRETNLGRCFRCETNFNPIDFTIAAREMDFVQAVGILNSPADEITSAFLQPIRTATTVHCDALS